MNEDPIFWQRLVGVATVFGVVLLLAWLIPPPQEQGGADDGHVVIRLDSPAAGRTGLAPDGQGRTQSRVQGDVPVEGAPAPLPERSHSKPAASPEPEPEPESKPDTAAAAPAPPRPAPGESDGAQWWIQAATYSDRDVAQRGRERVRSELASDSRLREAHIDGRVLWRLQVGPLVSAAEAEALAEQLDDAGFTGARAFRESGD